MLLGETAVTVEVATLAAVLGTAVTAAVFKTLDWTRSARRQRSAALLQPDVNESLCMQHEKKLAGIEAMLEAELPVIQRELANLRDEIKTGIASVHRRLDRLYGDREVEE